MANTDNSLFEIAADVARDFHRPPAQLINIPAQRKRLTLKEWKSRFEVGTRMKCVYRWMWHITYSTPARLNFFRTKPECGYQLCTVVMVQGNGLYYTIEGDDMPNRYFMDFPKAADLDATEHGFEYRFPADLDNRQCPSHTPGAVVSRYEWVADLPEAA